MELQVVYYPSPILRMKAQPIGEITDEIREIADAMLALMIRENGIGLAASQVGISKRLFVIAYDYEGIPPMALINPKIVSRSKQQVFLMEGCLSFPGLFTELRRPEEATIVATGLNGEPIELKADGLLARVIQHEFDHLDGRLFIDLFSPAQKIAFRSRLKELEQTYNNKNQRGR